LTGPVSIKGAKAGDVTTLPGQKLLANVPVREAQLLRSGGTAFNVGVTAVLPLDIIVGCD